MSHVYNLRPRILIMQRVALLNYAIWVCANMITFSRSSSTVAGQGWNSLSLLSKTIVDMMSISMTSIRDRQDLNMGNGLTSSSR